MEKNEDINYREILKDYIDEIIDDDVMTVLKLYNQTEKIKEYENLKYYGRYIIKRERDY
jgi:hypothetical protein